MDSMLEKYGLSQVQKLFCHQNNIEQKKLARVISDSRERYLLQTENGVFMATITGKLRFNAELRTDLPAVGDWVIHSMADAENAVIESVVERHTVLQRGAVGSLEKPDHQIIAANVDLAVLVMAADRDFNMNRLDRYLSLIMSGGAIPAVIINKSDLVEESVCQNFAALIFKRHPAVEVFSCSIKTGNGLQCFSELVKPGKTCCFVGSSGVGKSTMINYLAGREVFETSNVSESTGRGCHTTTSRHLHLLENGAVLIDTPGMREIAVADATAGIEKLFAEIEECAMACRFKDCTHQNEPGCAVCKALEDGRFDEKTLLSYRKLMRESKRFEEKIADRRRREKEFGKMAREVLKMKKMLKG